MTLETAARPSSSFRSGTVVTGVNLTRPSKEWGRAAWVGDSLEWPTVDDMPLSMAVGTRGIGDRAVSMAVASSRPWRLAPAALGWSRLNGGRFL